MGKKRKTGDPVPTSDPGPLTANPFGALAGLGAPPPAKEAEAADDEGAERDPGVDKPADGAPPSRAILSYERKGRGGKEVTLVELRGVSDGERASWLSQLKKALGCGGFLEGDRLAVTGDQRERVRAYLADRGVERITVG